MHYLSKEQEQEVKTWIGDAPNERQNWFCPWCGKESVYTETIDVGTASNAPR